MAKLTKMNWGRRAKPQLQHKDHMTFKITSIFIHLKIKVLLYQKKKRNK